MNTSETISLINKLSNSYGASGFEYETVDTIREYVKETGSIEEDSLHNLFVERFENTDLKPRLLLDAHTDEVSFMVRAIRDDGVLDFIPLGGMIPSHVSSQKVKVRNQFGDYITGIISSVPPHFLSEAERKLPLDFNDMGIDIGARSKDEAINVFGIRIGEPVIFDVTLEYQEKQDLLIGKAFDCRLGCACICKLLDDTKGEEFDVDLVAAFSVQEEVGTRGAIVSANKTNPDIAIVFEGCPADDTFEKSYRKQTCLKEGPMLRFIDSRMITNPRYQRFALDLAKEYNINVQTSVRTGGSTNGAPIHLSNNGVPVIVIGIPVRYIHTPYGIASYKDVEASVELAKVIIKRLNKSIIESF